MSLTVMPYSEINYASPCSILFPPSFPLHISEILFLLCFIVSFYNSRNCCSVRSFSTINTRRWTSILDNSKDHAHCISITLHDIHSNTFSFTIICYTHPLHSSVPFIRYILPIHSLCTNLACHFYCFLPYRPYRLFHLTIISVTIIWANKSAP